MKTAIVIPARLGSTRLPRKMLAQIGGDSCLRRTIKRCQMCHEVRVIVLTEDIEIQDHVRDLVECIITPPAANGSARIFMALDQIDAEIIINVQGDEPFVSPDDIERMIRVLEEVEGIIFTLDCDLSANDAQNRNAVKLKKHVWNECTSFTRSPSFGTRGQWRKHIGCYGWRRNDLLRIGQMSPTKNSIEESLEQITWLENGMRIDSISSSQFYLAIDTQEDLDRAREWAKFEKYEEN